jgi:hypothetical protein
VSGLANVLVWMNTDKDKKAHSLYNRSENQNSNWLFFKDVWKSHEHMTIQSRIVCCISFLCDFSRRKLPVLCCVLTV